MIGPEAVEADVRRPAGFAAQTIHVQIMQYRKQPLARIVPLPPLLQPRQCTLQRVLDEIIGLAAVADQSARVTPQARNFCRNGFPARGHARFLSYRPAHSRTYASRRWGPPIYSGTPIKIMCGQGR